MLQNYDSWTPSILGSLLTVIAGVVVAFYPGMTSQLFIMILSIIGFVFGLYNIYLFFEGKDRTFELIGGIILAIVSVYIYFNPLVVASILPVFASVLLIASAIIKIPSAIRIKKELKNVSVPIISSIVLPLVLGIIILFNPANSFMVFVSLFGLFITLSGVGDLIGIVFINKLLKGGNI